MRNLMLSTTLATSTLVAVLVTASLLPRTAAGKHVDQGTHLASQQSPSPAASGAASSTTSQGDQTDLSITVYNSDLALVRDVREITLPSGDFRLKFMDVAAS